MFFGTACVAYLDACHACQSAGIEERKVSSRTRNLLLKSTPSMGGLTRMHADQGVNGVRGYDVD